MKVRVDSTGNMGVNTGLTRTRNEIPLQLTFKCEPNSLIDAEKVWMSYDHNEGYEDWGEVTDPERERKNGYKVREFYKPSANTVAFKSEKRHPYLDDTMLVDNVSEALYECIEEGSESFNMLVCEIIDNNGSKAQVHITVTYNENDFIDNAEEMPTFGIDSEYRLSHERTV